jgi:hypothetical protein
MLRINAFSWYREYGCLIATRAKRGSLVINNWQRVEFSTDNIIKEKYECAHPSELPADIEYLMYTMMMPIPVPLAPGGYVSGVSGDVQITPLEGNRRWAFPNIGLERNDYRPFVDIYLSEGRVLEAYEYHYFSTEKKGVEAQAMALII